MEVTRNPKMTITMRTISCLNCLLINFCSKTFDEFQQKGNTLIYLILLSYNRGG